MTGRWGHYWRFLRPFTLLVPAVGMAAGALMALGAEPRYASDWGQGWQIAARIMAGSVLAGALNAFSNAINQIYDVEVDRINKPRRPLPAGEIRLQEAWGLGIAFLGLALGLAAWINRECLAIVSAAALLTFFYSAPPLRTKSRPFLANLTIAIPRGTLLLVCGWSTVKSVLNPEPWILGGILGLYFLGAATTKDFSDIEGDRQGHCRTLPVLYGVRRSIWIISPFFVLPFAGITTASLTGLIGGRPSILVPLGVGLSAWGAYIVQLLLKTPQSGATRQGWENHPSWRHMYLLTLAAQIGMAAAYLL